MNKKDFPTSKREVISRTFRHVLSRCHPDKIVLWRPDLKVLAQEITGELQDYRAQLMLDISKELDEMAAFPTNIQVQTIAIMSKVNSTEYTYQGQLNVAGDAISGKATRGTFQLPPMSRQDHAKAYTDTRSAWDEQARRWGFTPTCFRSDGFAKIPIEDLTS